MQWIFQYMISYYIKTQKAPTEGLFYMHPKTKEIHKETFATVFTGLIINYPLNIIGLFVCIDLLGMESYFWIGTTITVFMTVCAYTRVYIIRKHFETSGKKESPG